MFLWSVAGRIDIGDASSKPTAILRRVETALRAAQTDQVSRDSGRVSFSRSIFAPRWSPEMSFLALVDAGEVWLPDGEDEKPLLRYRFELQHTVSIVAAVALVFGLMLAARGEYVAALLVPVVAWVWMAGGALLMTRLRADAFLRETAGVLEAEDFWDE